MRNVSTQTLPTETPPDVDGRDLDHFICYCNPDFALCGVRVADDEVIEEITGEEDWCAVCVDLAETHWRTCDL